MAKTSQEKNVLSRSLALHLFEFLKDAKDLLGHKFEKNLEEYPNSKFLITELYRVKEYVNALHNAIKGQLGDIHYNTAAHKTKDSKLLGNMIDAINPEEIEKHALLVSVIYVLIHNFQANIMYSIAEHQEKEKIMKDKTSNNSLLKDFPKHKSTDSEFKRYAMIIYGAPAAVAEILCDASPELIAKIKEVAVYLENTKTLSDD